MSCRFKYQFFVLLFLSISPGIAGPSFAQTIDFTSPVSLHYDGVHLDRVLDEMSAKYGVGFSYSRQIVPVHQRIYIHVDAVPFGQAMESLFAQTQVIYGVIGNQLVLSVDVNKVPVYPDLGLNKNKIDDSLVAVEQTPRMYYEITTLTWQTPVLQYTSSSRITFEEVAYDLQTQLQQAEEKNASVRAQVTFVPPLSVDTDPRGEEPVNFSLNVLGGSKYPRT
jgi:hypothetical protein